MWQTPSQPRCRSRYCADVYAARVKKRNFPYLPSQNGLTEFCQILHDNSTPQRNHMLDGFSISVVVFYLRRCQIYHIPYTTRMASNTAYCTTVKTSSDALRPIYVSRSSRPAMSGMLSRTWSKTVFDLVQLQKRHENAMPSLRHRQTQAGLRLK